MKAGNEAEEIRVFHIPGLLLALATDIDHDEPDKAVVYHLESLLGIDVIPKLEFKNGQKGSEPGAIALLAIKDAINRPRSLFSWASVFGHLSCVLASSFKLFKGTHTYVRGQ